MNCPSFEILACYLQDDLGGEEAELIRAHVEECMNCTRATGRLARLGALVSDTSLSRWTPPGPPGPECPSPADFAGWSASGRTDIDTHVGTCPVCLARAVDLFRANAARDGRSLPNVPQEAVPARKSAAGPAASGEPLAPRIRMRGWPGRLELVEVPEGVRVDEDAHVKALSWKAQGREVLADVSPSGSGVGLRIRVRQDGELAGGIPVAITDKKSRKSYSNKPTDRVGEVLVRGLPLASFRVEVAETPIDVTFED